MSEFEKFWNTPLRFPLGLHCEGFTYDWRLTELPKDCATCSKLSFGKCSKGKIPHKKGD